MPVARMHHPGPPLDDLVACFWQWEGYTPPGARERALPAGTLDLVINLEQDELRFYADDGPGSQLVFPGATLCGAHARYFVIGTPPRTSAIGVHFKPGGAFPFLDLAARELEGRHAALDEIWGGAARALRERLLETPSEARFDVLAAWLLERARRPLARGARLKAALRAVEGGARHGAPLAAALGYFDQAHFDREFRHFTGLSPRAYQAHRIERPNHVPLRG